MAFCVTRAYADKERLAAIERAAADLFRTAGYDPAHWPSRPLTAYADYEKQGGLWVALAKDGVAAGFALVEILDDIAHLEEIDTAPEYARQGVASTLLSAIVNWAERRHFPQIVLRTFRTTPWSMNLYQKHGFTVVDAATAPLHLASRLREEKAQGLPLEDRVTMARKVTPASNRAMDLASAYDRAASSYDEMIAKSRYAAPSWFFDVCKELGQPGLRVLDVGCGNGHVGTRLKDLNPSSHLRGFDVASKMAEAALATGAYAEVYVQDLDQPWTRERDGSTDVVVALGCLEFANRLDQTLAELARVLRQGGSAYLTLQCHAPGDRLRPRVTTSGTFSHFAYTAEQVVRLLQDAGLAMRSSTQGAGYVAASGYETVYHFIEAERR